MKNNLLYDVRHADTATEARAGGRLVRRLSDRSSRSRLEDTGMKETVSYVFYPSGAQVSHRLNAGRYPDKKNGDQVNTKVARPSQNQEARLTEWYERLQ